MTFEEWKDCGTHNESPCRDMYEDWATDREELIAEKAEARKEEIEKLQNALRRRMSELADNQTALLPESRMIECNLGYMWKLIDKEVEQLKDQALQGEEG